MLDKREFNQLIDLANITQGNSRAAGSAIQSQQASSIALGGGDDHLNIHGEYLVDQKETTINT